MNTALLAGITVLDLSRLLPGPLATWHLASLGAKVAKIESPGGGDYEKRLGPVEGQTSLLYRRLSADKEVVPIDLTRVDGQREFLTRLRQADLVVESFRPGVLERLGLGFDRLRELNPRISLVSISGYGPRGEMAAMAGHDINFLALSGWLQELLPHAGPTVPNVQIGDLLGGALSAAFAAVSALLHAARTGIGTHLDVSMTAVLTSSNLLPLAYAQAGRSSPAPGCDLLNGGLPCYALYRTRDDRYVAVAALEAKFWLRFCEVLGRPDLSSRHWQSGQEIGSDDARAVRDELGRLFAEKPLSDWMKTFAGVDCCVTPVLRMDEVLEHPVAAEYLTSLPAGQGSVRSLRSGVRVLG
jgi:alpha-methylacyl-CoA racemase